MGEKLNIKITMVKMVKATKLITSGKSKKSQM
jgi:hypothetical protein